LCSYPTTDEGGDGMTRWLLMTDAFTNEALARELARAGITEESTTEVTYKEKKISVWEVPFVFARHLQQNKKTFPFLFTILVQEGRSGVVRKWNLQNKKRIANQKKVRVMRKKIKELKSTQEK